MARQQVDTDDDTTGDVISVNGAAVADETKTAEDRGDVVSPDLAQEDVKTTEKDAPAEAPAPAAQAKDETKPQSQHIPKARFDEVNTRKNELAMQLEEAQRQIEALTTARQTAAPIAQAAPEFDADAKESEYIEALIAGDTEAAKAIRREINANLIEQATAKAEERGEQRQQATTLQAASTQAVEDFPYLDTPEGEQALELILASRDAKIAQGMPPAAALRSAVAFIAPKFAPDPDEKSLRFADDKAPVDTRTAAAMARGATDSTLQPPTLQAGTGNRASAGRVNVSEMTEEQFENLSPAEKKRLRGDV